MESNTIINAGNFKVSIGSPSSEVAIISKSSGNFVSFKSLSKSKKLRLVRRRFKSYLNSGNTFTFSYMFAAKTNELINLLKS